MAVVFQECTPHLRLWMAPKVRPLVRPGHVLADGCPWYKNLRSSRRSLFCQFEVPREMPLGATFDRWKLWLAPRQANRGSASYIGFSESAWSSASSSATKPSAILTASADLRRRRTPKWLNSLSERVPRLANSTKPRDLMTSSISRIFSLASSVERAWTFGTEERADTERFVARLWENFFLSVTGGAFVGFDWDDWVPEGGLPSKSVLLR